MDTAAQGVYLGISSPAGIGYGGEKFQEGSFAVDLALNVAAVPVSPEAGTVVRRDGSAVRAPQAVCALVLCAAPPGPPEAPPPPAVPGPPATPAPPALLPAPANVPGILPAAPARRPVG